MYYEKQQEKESSSDEETEEQPVQQQIINNTDFSSKAASSNARAAAAWSMLYQGMALHEITIEPYTLTEILRLHISSSGVRIGKKHFSFCCDLKKSLISDIYIMFEHMLCLVRE